MEQWFFILFFNKKHTRQKWLHKSYLISWLSGAAFRRYCSFSALKSKKLFPWTTYLGILLPGPGNLGFFIYIIKTAMFEPRARGRNATGKYRYYNWVTKKVKEMFTLTVLFWKFYKQLKLSILNFQSNWNFHVTPLFGWEQLFVSSNGSEVSEMRE